MDTGRTKMFLKIESGVKVNPTTYIPSCLPCRVFFETTPPKDCAASKRTGDYQPKLDRSLV